MQIIKAHRGKVRSLDFSSVGDRIVSCGGRGTAVSLWTLPRAKRTYLTRHQSPVVRVRFSAQPGFLLTSEEFTAGYLWQSDSAGTWQPTLLRTAQAAFLQQGTKLGLVIRHYAIPERLQILDLQDRTTSQSELPESFPAYTTHQIAGSPVDQTLALAGYDFSQGTANLIVFRPGMSEPILRSAVTPIPYALAISPEGKTVAVGTTSTLQRFDLVGRAELPLLRGHTRMLTGVAYLPDGRLLSCSTDGTVRTWDHESGKCLEVRDWQLGPLTALCVARDGMRAAVGSDDGQILIWDVD